jgi:hypothetical protein
MYVLLGENRSEAVNRFQESLGPVTPRPLAEQTFRVFEKKGFIVEQDGKYLIEDSVGQADMRTQATAEVVKAADATTQAHSKSRSKGGMHHFNVNSSNFQRARIANSWSPQMASVFAPSLFQALGMTNPNPADASDD